MKLDLCYPIDNCEEMNLWYDKEIQLIEEVLNGEVDNALCILNTYRENSFYTDLSGRGCKYRSYKNHMKNICSLLCHQSIKKGVSPYSAKAKLQAFMHHLENAPSINDIIKIGQTMIIAYCAQITNQPQVNDFCIKQALHYIHNHLGEEINLEMVAEHVNLSKCYFSTQFKKETGQSFSNYLTLARIEKSKFFLAKTNKSILDIAILLGFNSQSYFSTQFKNYTNLTPKKYRDLHR